MLFFQWELGPTSLVLFVSADKRRTIVCILLSEKKYAGEFGVEDHHVGEVVAFVGYRLERREMTPILIHPRNLAMAQK